MRQPLIVLGDATDHGGVVIGAAPRATAGGQPIARVGDMVSCPRCGGNFPIVQGNPAMRFDGAAAAYDGCRTACGAALVASQAAMTTTPSGGGGDPLAGRLVAVASGLDAGSPGAQGDAAGALFRGRFQLLDQQTDQPLGARRVRVHAHTGAAIDGVTDAQGYTPWVERTAAQTLFVELVEDKQA